MNIIRVFPRKTSHTPTDDWAFIGEPPMMRQEASEVHISCCFTWDREYCQHLAKAWGQYYQTVKLGGPAYDDSQLDFTPGMYLKTGVTITSRGCNHDCDYCLVHKRSGPLRVIENFHPGYIIQDDNLLQCGRAHVGKVLTMLKAQRRAAVFSGGIEADIVSDWFAEELRGMRVSELFMACDYPEALPALKRAAKKLEFLGQHRLRCYVLIGKDETTEQAEARLMDVYNAGCLTHAQLYQPADRWVDYPKAWRELQRNWTRPAIIKARMAEVK